MQKKINVKQSSISIDKHCKYCLKPIAFYDLRCNGNCNTVAHYICTIRAHKNIQIDDHPDRFLCLWCSVFKLEENACRQFEMLAAETNNSDKSDDDISENSYKNIVTSKQSTNVSPLSLEIPLSPSSGKTNIVKSTMKSQSIFSTPVSRLLPNECFHFKPTTSCESDILNRNNTALSENSNKNIDTSETSLNIPLETLDVESSGNSSLGFFKTLFISPIKRSLNVTPKTPISESSQINNEIVNKSTKIDTPITPKTPITQNVFNFPTSLSPSPRASSPLVFSFLSSETKRDPHKKTQHFSEHTIEEFSNQYILQEMLLNLKQCKALLQQQIFYQKTTNSFQKETNHYLKSLEDLMKLNCDVFRTMQTQIYTIQEQHIKFCSLLKSILEK